MSWKSKAPKAPTPKVGETLFVSDPQAPEQADTRAEKPDRERCPACHGQWTLILASHLKTDRGTPLQYRACPADCNGMTRKDIAAGGRE